MQRATVWTAGRTWLPLKARVSAWRQKTEGRMGKASSSLNLLERIILGTRKRQQHFVLIP